MKKAIVMLVSILMLTSCGAEETPSDTPSDTKKHIWRMTSTFTSTTPLLGTLGKQMETKVNLMTGGTVQIKFHEPGVLAPAFETFDAVHYGAVEAGWSTAGYWAGKVPALQLFSSIPFGPPALEYLAWFDHGGGRELYQEIYHKHNIHAILCAVTPPESSGWYRQEMNSLEDFKNLKIRFFGLGAKVMEKIGASPQLIAGGEIFQALELGTIDATEYAFPSVDLKLGFYQVAKHNYFPGWHQQSTLFELMVNMDAWQALNSTQQAQVEAACSDNIRRSLAEGEATQAKAMAKLQAKGVEFHIWPPEILAKLKGHWQAVAMELSEADPDFKRVWQSLQKFRAEYKIWSDHGYLKD